MTFEIVIRSMGDCDLETVKKGLRKGLQISELSRGPEGTVLRCTLKNMGGRPTKMDESKTKEAARLYIEGQSIDEIAEKFQCKGPVIRAAIGNLSQEREEYRLRKYGELSNSGLCDNEIMRALNVSPYLYNNLKKKYPGFVTRKRLEKYKELIPRSALPGPFGQNESFEALIKGITNDETIKNVRKTLNRGAIIKELAPDPPTFKCEERPIGGFKKTALNDSAIKEVRDKYVRGVSVSDLAKEHMCTEQTIYKSIRGLADDRQCYRDYTVLQMKQDGEPEAAILEKVGITKPTLNLIYEHLNDESYKEHMAARLKTYATLLSKKTNEQ